MAFRDKFLVRMKTVINGTISEQISNFIYLVM
jgi:hypothetical protein